ncbi:hypothetical protein TanjilG_05610 [Lupinus angustifolius]|uniref:Potassium transporter n=1 Tax=Lupinus angustifolius TaxID=3871 RepID=A0A4P1QSC9_LUPAN|nr:hypothetical protein TanjilG_05610 [Lupinus angustifolius]
MDLESGVGLNSVKKKESWKTVMILAYQSLGVVYGEISTSPLYVYRNTFAEDIGHTESNEEIYGLLSLVFWTLTLVPLVKYAFIVLKADDNGEGGTFALYSLLCRHARVGLMPNCQLEDEKLSMYKDHSYGVAPEKGFGHMLKSLLEKHKVLQQILLVLALIGTCMVIGVGVLKPPLSVFSAMSGLELSISKEHHRYVEVPATCLILTGLFALQHYGTHRVGFLFAPIVITWLLCISSIGIYNIYYWNPHVYRALSPYYAFQFFRKTQTGGWMALGGILLCITGSEAMFVDLGHFSQLSIKIAFTIVVYPCLILAYMGQAAYFSRHHDIEQEYQFGFYVSVPGLAVVSVMLITTCLMSLVIVLCWHRNVLLALGFVLLFGTIEALFFSASIVKFFEGAWIPIALAFVLITIMYIWHYGTLKKYEFDVQNKVSINWLLSLGPSLGFVRVRGIGLVHTELVSGIPAIFSHFVTNLPAFHQVLVFLCIKHVPLPHVRPEERFLVGCVGPRGNRIYRCIVRYGYCDVHKDDVEFEKDVVFSIAEFIRKGTTSNEAEVVEKDDDKMIVVGTCTNPSFISEHNHNDHDVKEVKELKSPMLNQPKKRVKFVLPESPKFDDKGAMEELMEAREAGVTYIIGHSYMRAKQGSNMLKKIVISLGYEFLRRNSRAPSYVVNVPHASTLEVGIQYQV